MLGVFAPAYAPIMRINVANDFAQPISQSPLQMHIRLGMSVEKNTTFEMPKVHFCRTNPRHGWPTWSSVQLELPLPKKVCNSEKAISIAGTRNDEISRVKALKDVSLNFVGVLHSSPWATFHVFAVVE